jgi:uncharacterized repeat protein (TIGR01451 family)
VTNTPTITQTPTPTGVTILAVDDDFTSVPLDSIRGGTTTSIYVNDTLNGSPFASSAVTSVITDNGGLTGAILNANGVLTSPPDLPAALPYNIAPGPYTLSYILCQAGNPSNCSNAQIFLIVLPAASAPVTLTKVASPDQVKKGDLVRYTLTIQNNTGSDITNAYVLDSPPAGFTLVDSSVVVKDDDNHGALAGLNPIRINGIDIATGESATVSYFLRVGAGINNGEYTNSARIMLGASIISNIAHATVKAARDPLFEDSRVLGTVFDDCDRDGWQDSALATHVTVRGGFDASVYVPNSTVIERDGKSIKVSADQSLLKGIDLGELPGRVNLMEAQNAHQIVITQSLTQPNLDSSFVLTTDEGNTLRMDQAGQVTREQKGDAKKGLTSQYLEVSRHIKSTTKNDTLLSYTITNSGVYERGIPGVRIGTVEGLLVVTDAFGRFHLEGLEVPNIDRGRNFLMKVDSATLPKGSTFTTENPLLKRITQGLPVRFDFGVHIPKLIWTPSGGVQQTGQGGGCVGGETK